MAPSDSTRGNGHRLKHRGCPLDIRKHLSTPRETEPWHGLPSEAAESPTLGIFTSHLDTVQGNRLWVALLQQGPWTGGPAAVPSNLSRSTILSLQLSSCRQLSRCFSSKRF